MVRGGAYRDAQHGAKGLFPIYFCLSSHDFVGNYRKHLLFGNSHYYFGENRGQATVFLQSFFFPLQKNKHLKFEQRVVPTLRVFVSCASHHGDGDSAVSHAP